MSVFGNNKNNLGYLFKVANIKNFNKDLIIKIIKNFEEVFNLSHKTISYIFTPTRKLEGFISDGAIEFIAFRESKTVEDFLENFPIQLKRADYDNLGNTWMYHIFLLNDNLEIQYFNKEGFFIEEKSIREKLNEN